MLMKRGFLSFLVGVGAGIVIGTLVSEEEKDKIQQALNKRAGKLYKVYERRIREQAAKVKRFVEAQLRD
ncbi:MAG: hypothetical protein ACX93T_01035 [Bacteroidota bacterium]